MFAIFLSLCLALGASAVPSVRWETPVDVGTGGYARAHRLNDGRVMLVYCGGTRGWMRTSGDLGTTWSSARRLVDQDVLEERGMAYTNYVGNIDFAQLPAGHAVHPNRIVLSFNYRCRNAAKRPYSIHEIHSDDNGVTWSAPRLLFTANTTEGVYEPFVHVAGSGMVEIYTADESDATLEPKNQRIAKHVSSDGGDTWSAAQTVCRSMSTVTGWGGRDGMPAVVEWGGHTYLAIETRSDTRHLHPRVLADGAREVPLAEDVPAGMVGGSPYMAVTENYMLLCWQQEPARSDARGTRRRVAVAIAPKAEIPVSGSVARLFRGRFAPPIFDGPSERGSMWNALCPLEGDAFLLVTARSFEDADGKIRQRVCVTRGLACGD